jgi:small subunit ribosomal protein S4
MAIRTPIVKLSRRLGITLGKEKYVSRRPYAPGVHGPAQSKRKPRQSGYALQLQEKQRAKAVYGIRERQFRKYFEQAKKKPGNTATYLVELLERRLDNVVYRLGIASTRRQARQVVTHGFMSVNGVSVNVPSYQVRPGDIVAVRDTKKKKGLIPQMAAEVQKRERPKWLAMDAKELSGKVTSVPEGDDLRQMFDPTLIFEFYSR